VPGDPFFQFVGGGIHLVSDNWLTQLPYLESEGSKARSRRRPGVTFHVGWWILDEPVRVPGRVVRRGRCGADCWSPSFSRSTGRQNDEAPAVRSGSRSWSAKRRLLHAAVPSVIFRRDAPARSPVSASRGRQRRRLRANAKCWSSPVGERGFADLHESGTAIAQTREELCPETASAFDRRTQW